MLSRIADALFWIGRYVERADQTARLLDVGLEAVTERTEEPVEDQCRAILGVVGWASRAPAGCSVQDVLDILATDEANPSSVLGALTAARRNAHGAREVLPSEAWETLNVVSRAAPSSTDPARMHTALRSASSGCSAFTGNIDAFMPRDEAWLFLRAGRLLERLDLTARIVESVDPHRADATAAAVMLRSCGAYEAYLRTHRGHVEVRAAIGFLLQDGLFPRSAVHCLDRLTDAIEALAALHGRAGPLRQQEAPGRFVGQALASLRFRPLDHILADLPAEMRDLQNAAAAITDALTAQYIAPEE